MAGDAQKIEFKFGAHKHWIASFYYHPDPDFGQSGNAMKGCRQVPTSR
jgi:hypothetical protein